MGVGVRADHRFGGWLSSARHYGLWSPDLTLICAEGTPTRPSREQTSAHLHCGPTAWQASGQHDYRCTRCTEPDGAAVSPGRTALVVRELPRYARVDVAAFAKGSWAEVHRGCRIVTGRANESRAGAEAGQCVLDLAILLSQGSLKLGQACGEMVPVAGRLPHHATHSRDGVGNTYRRC